MSLTSEEQNALDALTTALSAAIHEPDVLLTEWQEQDLFDDSENVGLEVRIGEASSAAAKKRFPPLLTAVLTKWNGFDVRESPDEGVTVERMSAVDDAWNGFLCAEEVALGPGAELHFAGAFAGATVSLVSGQVVFSDGKGPPLVLAKSLTEFIVELVRTGLSIDALASKRM